MGKKKTLAEKIDELEWEIGKKRIALKELRSRKKESELPQRAKIARKISTQLANIEGINNLNPEEIKQVVEKLCSEKKDDVMDTVRAKKSKKRFSPSLKLHAKLFKLNPKKIMTSPWICLTI